MGHLGIVVQTPRDKKSFDWIPVVIGWYQSEKEGTEGQEGA